MSRTPLALLLLAVALPATAAERILQVDAFANGGEVRAQGAYALGEKFAVELSGDPSDYPLRIRSIQALFIPTYAGGEGLVAPFHLTIYVGTGVETPGNVLFDQADDFQLTASTGALNEIVLPTPIDIESGSIRVAFTASMDQSDSSVTIGEDSGPIQQTRNFIFSGGWNRAAALGLTGNFIIRAVADSNFGGGGSPPVVLGISPPSAPNDTSTVVTINGSGFVSGATARIGTTSLTGVTVPGSGSLSGTLQAGVAPGSYSVTVTNPDAQSSSLASAFEVTDGGGAGGSGGGGGAGGGGGSAPEPPRLTSIVPGVAPAGEAVSFAIFGTDLRAGARVTIGDEAATGIDVVSSTVLTGVASALLPVGPHDVTVENRDGGSDTLPDAFVVMAGGGGGLAVDRAVPSLLPYSRVTEVVILGAGFTSGAMVTIGGEPLTDGVLLGPSAIAGFSPKLDAGFHDVVVSYPDGSTASRADAIEVRVDLFGGPALAGGANGSATKDSGCGCAAGDPAGGVALSGLALTILALGRRRQRRGAREPGLVP